MVFHIILLATPGGSFHYFYFTEEEIKTVCILKHSGCSKMYEIHLVCPLKPDIIIIVTSWGCSKV